MTRGGKRSTSFVKGDKRINRKGAPKLTKEVKEIRKLTKSSYIELISQYLFLTLPALLKIQKEKSTPMLNKIIIKIFVEAFKKGDDRKLETMMTRIIGKVPDKVKTDDDQINEITIDWGFRK